MEPLDAAGFRTDRFRTQSLRACAASRDHVAGHTHGWDPQEVERFGGVLRRVIRE